MLHFNILMQMNQYYVIPRFYDVTKGEILIDGVNIKDVTQKELRSVIGFVPQKGVLFSGTIESNIKYSNENMSDDQMKLAAEIAQATEFIDTKNDKYKYSIEKIDGSDVEAMYLVDKNNVYLLQEQLQKTQKYLYLMIAFQHLTIKLMQN